jgi:hypothetical protein
VLEAAQIRAAGMQGSELAALATTAFAPQAAAAAAAAGAAGAAAAAPSGGLASSSAAEAAAVDQVVAVAAALAPPKPKLLANPALTFGLLATCAVVLAFVLFIAAQQRRRAA